MVLCRHQHLAHSLLPCLLYEHVCSRLCMLSSSSVSLRTEQGRSCPPASPLNHDRPIGLHLRLHMKLMITHSAGFCCVMILALFHLLVPSWQPNACLGFCSSFLQTWSISRSTSWMMLKGGGKFSGRSYLISYVEAAELCITCDSVARPLCCS